MSQSKQKNPKKQKTTTTTTKNQHRQTKIPQLLLDELLECMMLRGLWKSRANLSCDLLIFDPGPITPNVPEISPNRAKSNYSSHWKLNGDRASILTYFESQLAIFDFGHLQGVNWGQSWPKTGTLCTSPVCCLCKNSSFSKYFK